MLFLGIKVKGLLTSVTEI